MSDTTFSFITHWQSASTEHDAKITEFWKSEGALANDVKADDRLRQIVLHAETADGEVAAVSTAVSLTLPRLGQPTYYFRSFIGKKWRKTLLIKPVLLRSSDILEAYAREHNYPCIGVLLELENSRFSAAMQRPLWTPGPYVYIGKSQRNLDLRIRYFKGARLKKAKI